jgi:hypothetical protein
MPPSHRAVRGALHLLRPAERSDPTPPLYLPRIQGPSLTSRHPPVRDTLHLLCSAERFRLRVIDNLSLEPGSQPLDL